jgi:hypothetical protein
LLDLSPEHAAACPSLDWASISGEFGFTSMPITAALTGVVDFLADIDISSFGNVADPNIWSKVTAAEH